MPRRIVTYRPAGDERAVVPLPGKDTGRYSNERIYLKELTRYLHHDSHAVKKFAQEAGFVRKASLGTGTGPVEYVSPYAAMRIIAYIRAIQGEYYLRGKQFHEFNEKQALRKRVAKEKKCETLCKFIHNKVGSPL